MSPTNDLLIVRGIGVIYWECGGGLSLSLEIKELSPYGCPVPPGDSWPFLSSHRPRREGQEARECFSLKKLKRQGPREKAKGWLPETEGAGGVVGASWGMSMSRGRGGCVPTELLSSTVELRLPERVLLFSGKVGVAMMRQTGQHGAARAPRKGLWGFPVPPL